MMIGVTAYAVLGTALLSTIVVSWLARRTRAVMRAAAGDEWVIADLELAWDAAGFRALVQPLTAARCVQLAKAHDWDSAFAVAYSVMLFAWLEWLSQFGPSATSAVAAAAGLAGLAAGAFDLVENLCLQRCLRDARYTSNVMPLPADGLVRVVTFAAAIKFLLAGIAVIAIALMIPAALIGWLATQQFA
jgi:hypothetical protein